MEPREDELACIAIERPETSCLVDVDVEARCFLEFFSDALNQFGEADSFRSQDTHVPRTPVLRQAKTNGIGWSKAVAAPAPERIASNARIYTPAFCFSARIRRIRLKAPRHDSLELRSLYVFGRQHAKCLCSCSAITARVVPASPNSTKKRRGMLVE